MTDEPHQPGRNACVGCSRTTYTSGDFAGIRVPLCGLCKDDLDRKRLLLIGAVRAVVQS